MSNLTALDVVGVVFNGNNSQITYLPNCSAAVSYADYSVAGARDFDLRHWDYYKVLARMLCMHRQICCEPVGQQAVVCWHGSVRVRLPVSAAHLPWARPQLSPCCHATGQPNVCHRRLGLRGNLPGPGDLLHRMGALHTFLFSLLIFHMQGVRSLRMGLDGKVLTPHALHAAASIAVRVHVLLWGAPAIKFGAERPCSMAHVQRQPGCCAACQVSCPHGASHTARQLPAPPNQHCCSALGLRFSSPA